MRHAVLLVALSALGVASAQNFSINPGSVDTSTKTSWCNAEYNSCNLLCGGNLVANLCDVDTLNYNCTCSNGSAPGLQYYTQTIPTFICEQAYADCIAANTGSSRAQDDCKNNIQSKCGTLDPNKVQASSPSSSSAASGASATQGASSSGSASPSASAAQSAPSSSTSHGAAPTNAAYIGNGLAVVAAGVFAALL
ncbi:fb5a936c-9eee-4025-a5ab-dedb53f36f3a [Thermothielavioides terrestris]|uniref:Fb5a936c-9eee-4025-a5ab-dedb53f36f3a n=1 Tax=Thermothielavioides terrestris TaxID=2587410 RepID=A0A3S5CVT6_9PEZI|nr:fb5a936c-9eee-4025-a5ab-dedb53f36f3a [Thermothielavioides terrestris]